METTLIEGKHGRFHVSPHDTVIGRSLMNYGEYAEHELQLLSHWLHQGQSAIDVGANFGTHTVFFSTQVGSAGKVLALEAQPAIFDVLISNVAINNCDNVNCLGVACGAAEGMLELPALDYDKDGNFGAFSFCIDDVSRYLPVDITAPPVGVTVVPLEKLKIENCDLLKIDAEGMENEILAGAARLIENCRPTLYLENNNQASSPALIQTIQSFGYLAYWHVISYFRAANFAQFTDNIFSAPLELNLLCIPKEADESVSRLPAVASQDQWMPEEIAQGKYEIDELIEIAESFGPNS